MNSGNRSLLVWTGVIVASIALATWSLVASAPEGSGLGRVLWGVVNIALMLWLFRRVEIPLGMPITALARSCGFLLVLPVLLLDVSLPTPALHAFALALVFLALYVGRRKSKPGALGAALAIATLVVPPLVLVVPWLVARRHWRALAGYIAGLALGGLAWESVAMIPGGLPSVDVLTKGTFHSWGDPLARAALDDPTLRVLVHRVLRPTPAAGRALAEIVWGATGLVLLVAALFLSRRRCPGRVEVLPAPEIATALAICPLLAPTAPAGAFLFLWPAAMLALDGCRRSAAIGLRRWGTGVWAVAAFGPLATLAVTLGILPVYVADAVPLLWSAALLVALVVQPHAFPRARQAHVKAVRLDD